MAAPLDLFPLRKGVGCIVFMVLCSTDVVCFCNPFGPMTSHVPESKDYSV